MQIKIRKFRIIIFLKLRYLLNFKKLKLIIIRKIRKFIKKNDSIKWIKFNVKKKIIGSLR